MSSCCTGRRAAWRQAPTLRAAAASSGPAPGLPRSTPAGDGQGTVRLQYLGHHALMFRGPFSGRLYDVDAGNPLLDADAADAAAMLRSGWFDAVALPDAPAQSANSIHTGA